MGAINGIYDSEAIQPIAKIKEWLSIFTNGFWDHSEVIYQEPIPAGPATLVEMVVASGGTALAANATIAKRVVNVLQLNVDEFFQVRFAPIDNVEGLIWEKSAIGKFASARVHARVDARTIQWDPNLASTTFFIYGSNRDANLEVRNPMGYAIPTARFQFFGIRYVLRPFDLDGVEPRVREGLKAGDLSTVRREIGMTCWVPAEGRSA